MATAHLLMPRWKGVSASGPHCSSHYVKAVCQRLPVALQALQAVQHRRLDVPRGGAQPVGHAVRPLPKAIDSLPGWKGR